MRVNQWAVIAMFAGALFSMSTMPVARAQDAASEAQTPEERLAQSALEKLQDKMAEKLMNLKRQESQHYMMIFTNYTLMASAEKVRKDVSGAVNACIDHNPEMKGQLETRFEQWDQALQVSLEESYSNLEDLMAAQDYMPVSEFKAVFSLIDDSKAADENKFEKIPVTTPEACEFMLSKMDETQDTLSRMLLVTQTDFADVLRKSQE